MPADALWAAAAPRGSFERDVLRAAVRLREMRFGSVVCLWGMTVAATLIPRLRRN
jgi:hypothetical protein